MRLLTLLCFGCFLIGCKSSRYYTIEFKHLEDITLPYSDSKAIYGVQSIKKDGKDLVITFDAKVNRFFILDLNKKYLVDSFEVFPIKGLNNSLAKVAAFHYQNDDSIYIQLFPNYRPTNRYYHDSTLILIDRKRNIKGVFSFEGAPVLFSKNKLLPKDSLYTIGLNYFHYHIPLQRFNHKVYINFNRYSDVSPGDSLYSYRPNIVGYFDTKDPKLQYQPLAIKPYPWPLGNKLTKNYSQLAMTISDSGELICSYPMTKNILIFDLTQNQQKHVEIPSCLFDTVLVPLQLRDSIKDRKILAQYMNEYGIVLKDSFRNALIRDVRYGAPVGSSPSIVNASHKGIIVKSLKDGAIAEAICPADLNLEYMIIDPKGLLTLNWTKTRAYQGAIVFSRFTYKLVPTKLELLRKSLKEQIIKDKEPLESRGIIAYFEKELKLSSKNQLVVMMPIRHSCPSCFQKALNYLVTNATQLTNKNTHFLFMDGTEDEFKAIEQKYKVELDQDIILKELNLKHKKYIYEFINPRVIILEDGKITKDRILNPSEIEQLPTIIKEYIK